MQMVRLSVRDKTSDPAGTEDLDGRERTVGDPHKDEVDVETTTVSANRGL